MLYHKRVLPMLVSAILASSSLYLASASAMDISMSETSMNPVHQAGQRLRSEQNAMVNVNVANAEELAAKLRGVGLARARAIIELREQLGGFTDIDQLLEVRGLGIQVLNHNRDRIIL